MAGSHSYWWWTQRCTLTSQVWESSVQLLSGQLRRGEGNSNTALQGADKLAGETETHRENNTRPQCCLKEPCCFLQVKWSKHCSNGWILGSNYNYCKGSLAFVWWFISRVTTYFRIPNQGIAYESECVYGEKQDKLFRLGVTWKSQHTWLSLWTSLCFWRLVE